MAVSFIASAQADNAGNATVPLTVPAGVTTSHLGVIVVATQDQALGAGATVTGGGWTARDLNSAGNNNTTSSIYIWSRLGGVAAGNTITVNLGAVGSGATITGAWYDTGGRDITNVSAPWNNGGNDVGTASFNAPGHTGTRDLLYVLGHRTTSAVTWGALSPAGPTIDFQGKSVAMNCGALFAHHSAVSGTYTSTLASSVVSHNITTLQFALAAPPSSGSGTLARTATGTLTRAGAPKPTGSLARTATGTLTRAGTPKPKGTLARTAAGSLGLSGAPKPKGTLARTGSGTLAVAKLQAEVGALTRYTEGTLTLEGFGVDGVLDLGTEGTLVLDGGLPTTGGLLALTGSGAFTRSGIVARIGGRAGYLTRTASGRLAVTGAAGRPLSGLVALPGQWSAFARGADYGLTSALPIIAAQAVVKHMGLDKLVLTTPYTATRWSDLQPSYGVALYRNGAQVFSGPVTRRELAWDGETGVAVIHVDAVGDEIVLADRLAFPDPLRAADDQTVNDYWSFTGLATTAMRQLISDQAGVTARADRRVTGLVIGGADPGVGTSRKWTGLFDSVLDLLAGISAASGADPGVRIVSSQNTLTASVVAPRNLTNSIIFSADLSNVGSTSFSEMAPTVTSVVVAGQGDLHLRTRKTAATTDPGSTRWARQAWSYQDRRDTADATTLLNAAADTLANGKGLVSLTITLLNSEAATYGTDWLLGDRVTAYVGLPGESKVAVVQDVVRELTFTVNADGSERIQPAIGSVDARSMLPTPTQRAVTAIGRQADALTRNK